jgi:hypothetical protein
MKSEQHRREILQEINAITRMERGKLCVQSRRPATPPFHKLQCWPLANHERFFQQLAEEFVDLTIAQTRASDAERKKTPRGPSQSSAGNRSLLETLGPAAGAGARRFHPMDRSGLAQRPVGGWAGSALLVEPRQAAGIALSVHFRINEPTVGSIATLGPARAIFF